MEAPKLPSFIRQNKHKSFEFKPRYYDESKERIAKLRRQYHGDSEGAEGKGRSDFQRGDLSQAWRDNRQTKVKSSNRMLLIIILALLAITYFIIMY
ncbi:MAG: hypothetical protein NXI09_14910 [Bacteroidetes bacterium]|nr:hypothetical protein [Bacteroidota bacterium]